MKLKPKKLVYIFLFFGALCLFNCDKTIPVSNKRVGDKIDSLNGVYVFYNGKVGNVEGRTTVEGYNLGLKYQCVEFVKRYYYEHLNHKMPDSYGHAKDFFNYSVKDGQKNKQRNLIQYTNSSKSKPKANDLLVFDATPFNKYGHVAIISKVTDNKLCRGNIYERKLYRLV